MEIRPIDKTPEKKEEEKKEVAEEEEKTEETKKMEEEAEAKKAEEEAKKAEEEEQSVEKIDLSADELAKIFTYIDEEGAGLLSKESFMLMGKNFMKVVKETAMTSAMGIAGGKALRRLQPKEVVEVLKGPFKDDQMKVSRVFCKALKDDLEGWVSVEGNKKTIFMEQSTNCYKVIRKSCLTDSFEDAEANDDKSKQLLQGTVLEVRESPKKDEASGLTRMKGRVVGRAASDGMGWVTTTNKQGKVFLRLN